MPVLYIATSKNLAGWAADVGLTKHVYKLGVAEGSADDAIRALNDEGFAGESDWRLLKQQEVDGLASERRRTTGKEEKMVDPAYYPEDPRRGRHFQGQAGNVANHLLVSVRSPGTSKDRQGEDRRHRRHLVQNAQQHRGQPIAGSESHITPKALLHQISTASRCGAMTATTFCIRGRISILLAEGSLVIAEAGAYIYDSTGKRSPLDRRPVVRQHHYGNEEMGRLPTKRADSLSSRHSSIPPIRRRRIWPPSSPSSRPVISTTSATPAPARTPTTRLSGSRTIIISRATRPAIEEAHHCPPRRLSRQHLSRHVPDREEG
jgi:hypothetical protein